jgi:hypothetical protein
MKSKRKWSRLGRKILQTMIQACHIHKERKKKRRGGVIGKDSDWMQFWESLH